MNILVKTMPLTTRVPLRCCIIDIQKNITISAFNAKILKKIQICMALWYIWEAFWDDGPPFYLFLWLIKILWRFSSALELKT